MDQQQLAKWNADCENMTAVSQDSSTRFYTSKPYIAAAGGYVFKYRTYSPQMSRWTSADPSGFPNGVNNFIYTGRPTSLFDPSGLILVQGTDNPAVNLQVSAFVSAADAAIMSANYSNPTLTNQ